MLFLPGPDWLLLSKIARRLIYSLYIITGWLIWIKTGNKSIMLFLEEVLH